MATTRKRTWKGADGIPRQAWAVDFIDSNGKRQRRQFPTKAKADAFRVETEGQLRAGTHRSDADKITVRQVAQSYIDHLEGRHKRGERVSRRYLKIAKAEIWNYICPDPKWAEEHKGVRRPTPFTDGIAGVKLLHLTPPVVDAFRDRLRDAGVSVPMTRKLLSLLHSMLEFAIRQNFVAVNAARGVRVIGRRDEGSKKIVPPSKEVLRKIIGAAPAAFQLEIKFAAASGLRAGEQHALRWSHIDLEKSTVTVETRVDSYNEEDAPKSAAGVRTIPLGSEIVQQLREWKMRSKFSKQTDLVFPNRRGGYVRHSQHLQHKWYPLFEKLDIPRFNWHSLRHFAVSCWIEAGLNPKTVQTFVGHASLEVTMNVYGHMFPSDDHAKAMDAIAKELFS